MAPALAAVLPGHGRAVRRARWIGVGRQPLSSAGDVCVLATIDAYVHHRDATTRLANIIALMVGLNGPFYPLYVWWLAPEAGPVVLATMAASPGFLAIPWLARRHAGLARLVLPVLGLANTIWTLALLGPGTGAGVFIYPCILLAGLCWREPKAMLVVLAAGFAVQLGILYWPVPALSGLEPSAQIKLMPLNASSVAALLCFMAFSGARQMASAEDYRHDADASGRHCAKDRCDQASSGKLAD